MMRARSCWRPLVVSRVVLGAAVVLREVPVGVDEPAVLHAVERRIERAVVDLQHVVGRGPNPLRDAEPVHRRPTRGP